MTTTIAVPLWLLILLAGLALWAVADRLSVPSVRWLIRRRVNSAIEEVNRRLAIRIQPFKLTKREVLIDRVVYDPQVLEAVEEEARETQTPRQVVADRVGRYAREIVPAFNAYVYFRVGYWIARRAARALYRVRLGHADEAALAEVPEDATVVFVINHRSNMDYVLVSYLVAERAALSYAVGEWARIWPLESLIRAMGAFFVRRSSNNTLYRRVLQSYVAMATGAGVTQAVFPEGGLSRDGHLRTPKLGLLDYMLRAFDPEESRDVVFVPVGINYDRVLEDRTLLLDTLPEGERRPKPAFSTTVGFVLRNLGLMLRSEWHRFGYATVNLGKPLSARQWCRDAGFDPRTLERSERFGRIATLADELMGRVGSVIPVVPVSLVATVFVEAEGEEISELELKTRAAERLAELEARGARVYVPRRDQDYAVTVGLRMLVLRHLVEERDGLFRARESEMPLLRYYAASIAHLSTPGGRVDS